MQYRSTFRVRLVQHIHNAINIVFDTRSRIHNYYLCRGFDKNIDKQSVTGTYTMLSLYYRNCETYTLTLTSA